MRRASEYDGSCPSQGVLVSFGEIVSLRADEWWELYPLCSACETSPGPFGGLCGACLLEEWKRAQA